jgi:beta-lactamase regulating signal transducer with metallopeptidase domain
MWPLELLDDPAWRPLNWTLLNFLWQGMVVAAVWKVLFRLARARSTQTHYLLRLAGLLAMAACPLVTIVLVKSEMEPVAATSGIVPAIVRHVPEMAENVLLPVHRRLPAPGSGLATWKNQLAQGIGDAQPYLLGGWIAGLIFFSGRLLLGAVGVYRLGRGRRGLSDKLCHRTAALARRMGFGKVPGVFASVVARESMVTGFLRPLVLLPVAWLAEMPPEVLEAVIAHELAHIRRFDLWVNLFQRFLETLLFYHPAVWWLSHRVRLAREMCCDELAAAATGERMVYATALELAARKRLRPAPTFLEVALGVTRMTLLKRVRNVLGLAAQSERGRWWPAAVLALLVPPAVWLISTTGITSAQEKKPANEAKPVGAEKQAASAVHRKYTATAVLQVRFETPTIIGATPDLAQWARDRFEIYKAVQQQLLVSRFVLLAALREPQVAKLPSIRHAQQSGDPVKWLQSRLQVSFPGKAEIMEVRLTAENPMEAATLLQGVVDAYMHEIVNTEVDRRRMRLAELDRAVAEKEKDIRDRRGALKKLATELGTSSVEVLAMKQKLALEELSSCRQELRKLQAELRAFERDLVARRAALKDIERIDASDPAVEAEVRNDPIVRELSVELGWLRSDKMFSQHPDSASRDKAIKAAQEKYDARVAKLVTYVHQKMQSKTQSQVRQTEAEIAVQADQLKEVSGEVEQSRKEVEKLGNAAVDLEMLLTDIKNADLVLNQLASERDRMRVESRAQPRISLLQAAQKPEMPDSN